MEIIVGCLLWKSTINGFTQMQAVNTEEKIKETRLQRNMMVLAAC